MGYRLTQKFMRFYKTKDFSHVNFAKHRIDSSDIFEEIPMKVHNSHLIHAFLYELQSTDKFSCTFDRLNLTDDMLFKRNLEIMSKCVDELVQDQSKFSYSQRQRIKAQQAKQKDFKTPDDTVRKNLPNYLGRMDAYLTAHKITHYSKKLESMVGQSMTKMFEVDALSSRVADES